jgi:hypothetical protein
MHTHADALVHPYIHAYRDTYIQTSPVSDLDPQMWDKHRVQTSPASDLENAF